MNMTRTSQPTPHGSGLAALLLTIKPGLDPDQLKQEIMDNVNPVPAFTGKMVHSGRITALKSFRVSIGEPTLIPTETIETCVIILSNSSAVPYTSCLSKSE